jgi:hypothetical protein
MSTRTAAALATTLAALGAGGVALVLAEPGSRNRELPPVLAEKLAAVEDRIEETGRPGKPYDAPAEAQTFFLFKRAPDHKSPIPFRRYEAAMEHSETMPHHSPAGGRMLQRAAAATGALDTWAPLGPGNVGGRTRALVVDPTTPTTMYTGAASGGIWKTTDGGTSWTPLDDLMANIAVSALAMDPSNPNVLYAGTGEGVFAHPGGQLENAGGQAPRGAGIFKTTDAGATWTSIGGTAASSDFHFVNDLVVSADGSRVYAATGTGIMRSLNGGTSWAKVLGATGVHGCLDLVARTDVAATDVVLAACGTFAQGTVYRNLDAGGSGTWTQVLSEAGMGRTSLAVAPSNQAVMYALSASTSAGTYGDGLHAVFRSADGGATWSPTVRNTDPVKLNTVLLSNPVFAFLTDCGFGATNQFINQGWYDNVIAVDPVDPNRVWAGGIDLFRSDDGGANWGMASHWWGTAPPVPEYAHADQHRIVFHPDYNGTTNQTMWVGNDGGVFRTNNARASVATGPTAPCNPGNGSLVWQDLNNGYRVTQFYDGVAYPGGQTYFGGTQDNGTVRGTDAGGQNSWSEILGGDGGSVAVDPTNTNVLYAENTGLSIQKSTNGGGQWTTATGGISDSGFQFIAPFELDPSANQRLWAGGFHVWRTGNGAASWTRASNSTPGSLSVSAIGIAPSDPNRVLVGMGDGFVARPPAGIGALSTTAGTIWSSTQPRAGYVSSLAFDPADPDVAYATYSTFGGTHVWKSTDAGATWTGLDGTGSGTLPDIPAHTIVVDPGDSSRLYLGTDLGVYVSLDGGVTWAVENTGFANVITETLQINQTASGRTLFAFTHGRGVYRVALGPSAARFTLSVTRTGNGTVTSSPAGIDCGSTCAAEYDAGAMVTLTADPDDGWSFAGWSGGGCAGTGTCVVTMNAARTVGATFVETRELALTTSGEGTVTSSPAGILCPPTCSAVYPAETVVTLTAGPAEGWRLAHWSGACAGTGGCTVTMSGDRAVTATFVRVHRLTVSRSGNGHGVVTSSPAGISCGAVCSAFFDENTVVTLTQTPAPDSDFGGWSASGCSGVGRTCVVTMSGLKVVGALFVLDVVPPNTKITAGPAARTRSRRATFRFRSTEAGSTFRCRLDGGATRSCSSPRTYRNLRPGLHTFRVRAIDPAGNSDPTPAAWTWRILR